MHQAMIIHFSKKPMPARMPADVKSICFDIIELLSVAQPFWAEGKFKDMTVEKRRFRALYDKVRGAWKRESKIREEVKAFVEEQEAEMMRAKEEAEKAKEDTVSEDMPPIECTLEPTKEEPQKQIITMNSDETAQKPAELTKRQLDLLTEAVMANLHSLVNESAKNEIIQLKMKVKEQDRLLRNARWKLASICIDADQLNQDIARGVDDMLTSPKKSETPKLASSDKQLDMMQNEWIVIYDWNDWTVKEHDEFVASATDRDWLNFELLLYAAEALHAHAGLQWTDGRLHWRWLSL